MKTDIPPISHEALIKLLAYNKHTGSLTWRVNRSRLAKAGDAAGSLAHTGTVMVGIQGRTYTAATLIWLYVTGVHPVGKIRSKDGDPNNLRWNNFIEENATLSTKHSAVYQRRRRKILQIAKAKIASDPTLNRMYMAPQNLGERHILQKIAAEVEDDMLRNRQDPAFRPPAGSKRRKTL